MVFFFSVDFAKAFDEIDRDLLRNRCVTFLDSTKDYVSLNKTVSKHVGLGPQKRGGLLGTGKGRRGE